MCSVFNFFFIIIVDSCSFVLNRYYFQPLVGKVFKKEIEKDVSSWVSISWIAVTNSRGESVPLVGDILIDLLKSDTVNGFNVGR